MDDGLKLDRKSTGRVTVTEHSLLRRKEEGQVGFADHYFVIVVLVTDKHFFPSLSVLFKNVLWSLSSFSTYFRFNKYNMLNQ